MADRVHPRDSPPVSAELPSASPQESSLVPQPLRPPPSEKPVPPPGTYVIKIPKDQVYRVPPAENARRYDQYTQRRHRRSRCCCCCCWLIGIIFIFVVLLGIAAGIFYLVFRPEAPKYSIENIAVRGINLTSSSAAAISPEFNVTVKADNPNDKIGIYYLKDSSAEVFYNDARLCNGVLPAFYQPSNNVTAFGTVLKGNEIELRSEDRRSLVEAQTKLKVPLTVRIRVPVKIKVGSVKTWKITVKVDCDVTVNELTAQSKIVSKSCDYKVDPWP
ncbi:unnamed protein product [Sphenostylis stenocarpa]|uniref:Late embryogenesis abundant protein LEA-2 subgroup domain-containing protein n=1 Tax=Sphenostylis stenocarpa TaxID=92480 RepID=A0AA86VN67_9FABA|nr:unnamed protein product [Sphenostylis stenocarpa]